MVLRSPVELCMKHKLYLWLLKSSTTWSQTSFSPSLTYSLLYTCPEVRTCYHSPAIESLVINIASAVSSNGSHFWKTGTWFHCSMLQSSLRTYHLTMSQQMLDQEGRTCWLRATFWACFLTWLKLVLDTVLKFYGLVSQSAEEQYVKWMDRYHVQCLNIKC
jgi:hypothetical protein